MSPPRKITRLDCPPYHAALMEGPAPPNDYEANGCGGAKIDLIPDSIGPIQLRAPCVWHDFAYSEGGGKRERFDADCYFFRNLRRVGLPRLLSLLYFAEVRLWGHRYFTWTTEPRPKFLAAFFESFFSRIVRF